MPQPLSRKKLALLRQALESEQAEVKQRLARNWEQTVALEAKVAAAASIGLPHEDLDDKMEILRRRSMKLGERGQAIYLNLSALVVVDNGVPGARWRPSAAEPF